MRCAVLALVIACASCVAEPSAPRSPTVNQPPVPRLLAPTQARVGELVEVDGRDSFDLDGDVVEAVIRFGDGSPPQSSLLESYRYAEPGVYLVELYLADDERARSRARARIVITP